MKYAKNGFLLALAVGATASQAAGIAAIDVTDVVLGITNQLTPLNLIGAAVLGLVVAVSAYKWVRRAIA